jgi:hypothetical protein
VSPLIHMSSHEPRHADHTSPLRELGQTATDLLHANREARTFDGPRAEDRVTDRALENAANAITQAELQLSRHRSKRVRGIVMVGVSALVGAATLVGTLAAAPLVIAGVVVTGAIAVGASIRGVRQTHREVGEREERVATRQAERKVLLAERNSWVRRYELSHSPRAYEARETADLCFRRFTEALEAARDFPEVETMSRLGLTTLNLARAISGAPAFLPPPTAGVERAGADFQPGS